MCPAGALSSVRSGAGTPQVPCPVYGVVQTPCTCPAQCMEWCRIWPTEFQAQRFPGDFLLAPTCPIEKVTLPEDFLYLTSESETDEGVAKDKVNARTGNRTRDSGSKAQYAIL